ncbi:MAG: DUF3211 family protein [Sulfolobaceae archaeon]
MYRNEFELILKTTNFDKLLNILSNPLYIIEKLINIKEFFQININKYKAKIGSIGSIEIEIDKELIKTGRSFMLRYLLRRESFPKLFCKIEIYGIIKGNDISLKVIYERENSLFNFLYDLKDLNEDIIKKLFNNNELLS